MYKKGFQFLIGRLKTIQFTCFQVTKEWFQFLIGRLKTGPGDLEAKAKV